MNKILVTGGGGFIGSHVAEYFAKRGNEVVVFDNLSRSELLKTAVKREEIALYNWNYLRELDNVELVRGDIRRRDDVEKAAKDVDAIIHTAAQVAVTSSLDDPISDFEINALGTFNVLEAARKSKERPTVIYCSTNKVYGENVNKIPVEEKGKRYVFADYKQGIPEDFSIDNCAHTPYGCSKLTGDLYVQDYGRREEIETGVFRMSCIYGTRQFGSEDQGWVAHFIISTLTDRPITIYGDGKQLRDVLFVTDLVELFDRFLDKSDKYSGEVFNAGGGPTNTLSLLELLELLEKETSIRPQVSYSGWRPSDQKVYISDISKAKKKLGWEPKIGVEEGVSKLISFVRENKELFKT
jgi:CDP-paratose 2-epimerase